MTTYTFDTVYTEYDSHGSLALVRPGTFSMIMAPGQDSFTYQLLAGGPAAGENWAEVTSSGIYRLLVDGAPVDADEMNMEIVNVSWGGGNVSTAATFDLPWAGRIPEFAVYLGGDTLPELDSVSAFMNFGKTITDFSNVSSGPLAPGQSITLASLPGVTVTEKDVIPGTGGADIFDGGIGRDILRGFAGDDALSGGPGFDTLVGGDGADTLTGGFGRDKAFMGAGNDLYRDNGQGGARGRDIVFANQGDDTIQGGNGDDAFYGQLGKDLIFGRKGDDALFGGSQADILHGGAGNDTLTGGLGRDKAFMGGGNDLYRDNGQGGAFGRDTVFGGAGDDTIQGGNGDDVFRGMADDDRIFGRLGNDRLDGGKGSDTLTGGDGADSFVFADGDGADRVTDFAAGRDMLRLDAALWSGTLSAAQVVTQFASASGGNVVFDFGGGDTLTLEGLTSTAGLESDLVIL